MEYEDLLNEAYESVKPCIACERFEIKKVEGHHEGTRTVITNFIQVTSCLRRNEEHLAKFLFKSMATSGIIDGDRLVLDRKISSKEINEKVEKYVKQFVSCSGCKKPDTELVEENDRLYLRCMACGMKKPVSDI